jgi:hypothetical protein
MVKVISFLVFLNFIYCSNNDILLDYLNDDITNDELLALFDTTDIGVKNTFKGLKATREELQGNGVYFKAIKKIFTEFNNGEYRFGIIIEKLSEAADGWISSTFSSVMKEYSERNKAVWIALMINQGKDSKLLSLYIYGSKKPFKKLPLFNDLSADQMVIMKYLEYQLSEYTFE